MFHQKLDHATLGTTYETLETLFTRINHERTGMPNIMKWAAAYVADSLLFQVNEITYDILDVRSVDDPVDDVLFNSSHKY